MEIYQSGWKLLMGISLIKRDLPNYARNLRNSRTFDGLWVADGALYSADNLTTLTGLTWLTRVPLSIKEASILVNQYGKAYSKYLRGI